MANESQENIVTNAANMLIGIGSVVIMALNPSGAAQKLDVELHVLAAGPGGPQKADFVQALGASQVVAMGNGANDAAMLRAARLGIAVLGDEGLAPDALAAATIVVRHAHDGLDLLRFPTRLSASLRP